MHRSLTMAATALLLFWFGGCAGSAPAPVPTTPAANGAATGQEHDANHDHGSASPDVAANLAKLLAEDRAAAEKQRVCPVSNEPLGSMGVPIKVDVKGQSVWICCDGCREDLLADPGKYVAKLK